MITLKKWSTNLRNSLLYAGFIVLKTIFCYLPWRAVYYLSDLCYSLTHSLLRLGRRRLRETLKTTFPEKSPAEIIQLTRRCYRHLCDFTLESIKGFSLTPEALLERWHLTNPELLSSYFERDESLIGFMGHYGNWELGIASAHQLQHTLAMIYKPLKNPKISDNLAAHRAKHRALSIDKRDFMRTLLKRRGTPTLYILLADQRPAHANKRHQITFLGRTTDCLLAPGIVSKKFNMPAFYVATRRVRRGHYEGTFIPLPDPHDSNVTPEHIVEAAMRELEVQVSEHPEYWFWSTRRWRPLQ